MKELKEIQQKLKAPKRQYNSYADFNYRNVEDILEAVKPLLNDALLLLNDDIVEIGGRVYLKATVTLSKDKEAVSVTAYAREPLKQTGMSESQITGSASSYARKYALSGLFLLDDQREADPDQDPKIDPKIDPKKVKIEATRFNKMVETIKTGDYTKAEAYATFDLTSEQKTLIQKL